MQPNERYQAAIKAGLMNESEAKLLSEAKRYRATGPDTRSETICQIADDVLEAAQNLTDSAPPAEVAPPVPDGQWNPINTPRDVCWHCQDALIAEPRHCENCPDWECGCDDEECQEPGCLRIAPVMRPAEVGAIEMPEGWTLTRDAGGVTLRKMGHEVLTTYNDGDVGLMSTRGDIVPAAAFRAWERASGRYTVEVRNG